MYSNGFHSATAAAPVAAAVLPQLGGVSQVSLIAGGCAMLVALVATTFMAKRSAK